MTQYKTIEHIENKQKHFKNTTHENKQQKKHE